MSKFARLVDGVVVEILSPPEGMAIAECFHPTVLASSVLCGDDVQLGWVYVDGVLSDPENPPVIPEPIEPLVEEPVEPSEETTNDEPVAE